MPRSNLCQCGEEKKVAQSQSEKNPNRWFEACPQVQGQQCRNAFKWLPGPPNPKANSGSNSKQPFKRPRQEPQQQDMDTDQDDQPPQQYSNRHLFDQKQKQKKQEQQQSSSADDNGGVLRFAQELLADRMNLKRVEAKLDAVLAILQSAKAGEQQTPVAPPAPPKKSPPKRPSSRGSVRKEEDPYTTHAGYKMAVDSQDETVESD